MPIALDGRALAVLPIEPRTKRPRCAGGCYGASADPAVIDRLFATAPGSGIAVATGGASGIDVLDIDPRNGGDSWLAANALLIPYTLVHRTPRGGWHIVLRHVEGLGCPATLKRHGVDMKGDGGYVGWPPTPGYTVARAASVADWPAELLALVHPEGMGRPHPRAEFSIEALRDTFTTYPKTAPRWSAEESYGYVAFRNAYGRLSTTRPGGRGSALNREAYMLGGLVARGWLGAESVVRMLLMACEANRLIAKDGPHRVLRELFRGFSAGLSRPHPGLQNAGGEEAGSDGNGDNVGSSPS